MPIEHTVKLYLGSVYVGLTTGPTNNMYVSVLDYICAHYERSLSKTWNVKAGLKVTCAELLPCPAYMNKTSLVLLLVYKLFHRGTDNIILGRLVICQTRIAVADDRCVPKCTIHHPPIQYLQCVSHRCQDLSLLGVVAFSTVQLSDGLIQTDAN